ncbi:MAG TPA: hypothetical protein VFY26_00850 [Anaerolineales bacterium]|nr:hypothetical protein [Anaerolineales bacterium]
MSAQPDHDSDVQQKLQDGLRLLEEASEQDRDRLGLALLKLHGALADCIRLELSQKAPHTVRDVSQASWQDLIRYGRQYLGLSEGDARLMSEAERQRQQVARGGTYANSRAELAEYAGFVERRCAAAGEPQPPIQPGLSVLPDLPESGRPWYVSNWLILIFPAVLMVFFCIIGILSYSDNLLDMAKRTLGGGPSTPAATSTAGALPSPTFAIANTKGTCTIIWVEYAGDLGHKSRAWVYEELIANPVKDAGLTARKFYEQVVEHNPVLEADDYEFMSGQSYLLPQCQ